MARTTFSGPVKSLAGFSGTAATISDANITVLAAVTADAAEINKLDGVTATTAEINKLAGLKSTTTELNLHTTLDTTNVETFTAVGANTFTLTKRIHKIDTTAGAQTCTPAAPGAANLGVVHVIEMVTDGGTDCVLTLTNFNTGNGFATSTATFNDAGDYMIVIGGVSKWHILDSTATHA